jgi:DNA-binding NtrC family response regulator
VRILVVDDQASARRYLVSIVTRIEDVEVREADSLATARAAIATDRFDVALIDLRLSSDARDRDGLTLVSEIREKTTALPIIVTASHEMAEIRMAMRLGAHDYILKDDLCEELVLPLLSEIRTRERLEREVRELRARSASEPPAMGLVGSSRPMQLLRETVRRAALSDRPILVVGPTGSGKELVVAAIHAQGPHPDEPLLDLNCGAIPEALMESQLFGHERGAFTGADRRQDGYFALVRKGTLFLDEIAELTLPLQAKLLRVLESGRFRPVGSSAVARFGGRIVAATHANLPELVSRGQFREDLLYRLDVLTVPVPALAERTEDIPALVAHFVRQQPRALRFSAEAMDLLCCMPWPGNVRQLRNLIDRLAVFAEDDQITPDVLRPFFAPATETEKPVTSLEPIVRAILRLPVENKLAAIQEALIAEAMALCDGNKSAAARLLGVHRKAVERRVEKGLADDSGRGENTPGVTSGGTPAPSEGSPRAATPRSGY